MTWGDVKLNNLVDEDGMCRCHGNLSPVHSSNGDIARLSVTAKVGTTERENQILACINQRIYLWKATKKGERPLSPEVGCCIRDYINEPLTVALLQRLKRDVAHELSQVFPEFDVNIVKVWSSKRNEVTIESNIGNYFVTINSSSSELDELHRNLAIVMSQLGMTQS